MDLAYVDKLAKEISGVKYPLVRQYLFDRTVHAEGMQTEDSKETVCAFPTMNKKIVPKNLGFSESAGEFEDLCITEGIQIYSTMSETKDAFAERTIRSLKNVLYRYMEDNGYKYIHN